MHNDGLQNVSYRETPFLRHCSGRANMHHCDRGPSPATPNANVHVRFVADSGPNSIHVHLRCMVVARIDWALSVKIHDTVGPSRLL
jgi:hypothetical protein